MTIRDNGSILGKQNAPSLLGASGIWSLSAMYYALQSNTWPGKGYVVTQIFTASGTWTSPTGVTVVEYLVVAGGGGGGGGIDGGAGVGAGGGAGGYRTGTGLSVTAGTDYTITVGGGGAGGDNAVGTSGSTSTFSTISSAGGGGGGRGGSITGLNGGSGGGGARGGSGGLGNTPNTSPSQGNDGGSGSDSAPNYGGGGGVSDGDKGDITVSSSGTQWTVDNDAISYAKIQNVSAASRLLGRGSAGGSGDVEEITIGTGLSLSGTTLSATGGGGGADGTVLSPTQITAWQNNYNPSSWANTVGVLRINSNQFHFLSGLTATSDGHTVRIFNTGSYPIGLYNQNTDSTAANRFSFDDHDVIILPQNSVELYYDGTAERWSLAAGWTLNSESQFVSKYWNEAFSTAGDNHGATAALWGVSGGTATASTTGKGCRNSHTGSDTDRIQCYRQSDRPTHPG